MEIFKQKAINLLKQKNLITYYIEIKMLYI